MKKIGYHGKSVRTITAQWTATRAANEQHAGKCKNTFIKSCIASQGSRLERWRLRDVRNELKYIDGWMGRLSLSASHLYIFYFVNLEMRPASIAINSDVFRCFGCSHIEGAIVKLQKSIYKPHFHLKGIHLWSATQVYKTAPSVSIMLQEIWWRRDLAAVAGHINPEVTFLDHRWWICGTPLVQVSDK